MPDDAVLPPSPEKEETSRIPPPTLGPLYKHICARLEQGGIPVPDLEARFILDDVTAQGWADVIAFPDRTLDKAVLDAIDTVLERRIRGEPLSRITGKREFRGLEFIVTEETLDPRPDTETLVQAALDRFKGQPAPDKILDLGTGTGCILISLLTEWTDSYGVAVDLSHGALVTARENAKKHGVDDRISFVCGSWAESIGQNFDCVVSNPPYIENHVIANLAPEVKNHDPILALDGGEDGLNCYKTIFSHIENILKPDGSAFFEVGINQDSDLVRLAEKTSIRIEAVHHDIAGRARVVEISRGDN